MLRPEIDQAFLVACEQGDLSFIQKHTRKDLGLDLVHLGLREACLNRRKVVVKWLLGMGAWDLEPGLEGACLSGDVDLVKLMIQDGARNWTEGYACALLKGNQEVVQFFETIMSEVNGCAWLPTFCSFVLDGERAWEARRADKCDAFPTIDCSLCLRKLCESGRLDLVEHLLDQNSVEIDEWHFRAACGSGHLGLVQFLLGKAARRWEKLELRAGLVGAAEKQQMDVLKFLLKENGVQPTKEVLFAAVQTGNYLMSELLCSKLYTKVPKGTKRQGRRYGCSRDTRESTAEEILGDEVQEICKYACRGGNVDIIKMVLEDYGASEYSVDFESACLSGSTETIQFAYKSQWWRGLSGAIHDTLNKIKTCFIRRHTDN